MSELESQISPEARNFQAPDTEIRQPDFVINVHPEAERNLRAQNVSLEGTRLNFPNASNYHPAGTMDFGGPHYKGMNLKPVTGSVDVLLENFYQNPSRKGVQSQNYVISKGALFPDFNKEP